MVKYMIALIFVFNGPIFAWDDHPDRLDYSDTDRLFKACQKRFKAHDYEIRELERQKAETLRNYKASKFKKQAKLSFLSQKVAKSVNRNQPSPKGESFLRAKKC